VAVLDEQGVSSLPCDCSWRNERLGSDNNLECVPTVTDYGESEP